MNSTAPEKTWNRTSVQNLMRHKSGRYYARIFANGKETWKALKTDILEVAKVKLREIAGDIEKAAHATHAEERGSMTMEDCAIIFTNRLESGFGLRGRGENLRRIRKGTIHYRKQTLLALWRSWPGLAAMNARKVPQREVENWAERFAVDYSPSRYNNTLDTLRALFQIAIDAGARIDNPAAQVGRVAVKGKRLNLPTLAKFAEFVTEIRNGHGRMSKDCGDLTEGLAYTGMRIGEAREVTRWSVSLKHGTLRVEGDPEDGTKNGEVRYVPLIPQAHELFTRMLAERPDEDRMTKLFRVGECQKSMDRAAEKVGMARITHHDLRHLFATICIESGVDIPTVSRWLGHKDGGALAMKTYGHLRDEHSIAQAKKVSFTSQVASPQKSGDRKLRVRSISSTPMASAA
jgi:integrase